MLIRFFSVESEINTAKWSTHAIAGGNVVQDGHKKGVPIADVWDIPFLNPKANERVGYPTQKPILLLERIISLVTSRGDSALTHFVAADCAYCCRTFREELRRNRSFNGSRRTNKKAAD